MLWKCHTQTKRSGQAKLRDKNDHAMRNCITWDGCTSHSCDAVDYHRRWLHITPMKCGLSHETTGHHIPVKQLQSHMRWEDITFMRCSSYCFMAINYIIMPIFTSGVSHQCNNEFSVQRGAPTLIEWIYILIYAYHIHIYWIIWLYRRLVRDKKHTW